MNVYQFGKIYKVFIEGNDECYVGSTTESLKERMYNHQYSAFADSQQKTTCCILFYEGDPKIELLEEYPCNSRLELETRERYWIEQLHAINQIIPTRTWKERWEANKTHDAELHKEWILKNKLQQKVYKQEKRAQLTPEQRKAVDDKSNENKEYRLETH